MQQVLGSGIETAECVYEKENVPNLPSLLLCFCVSDVVMSVCRRCVGRPSMEMGGKAGRWGEIVSKFIFKRIKFLMSHRSAVSTVKVVNGIMQNIYYYM